MRIGVYGSASGDITAGLAEKARTIGREIARLGHVVVTGGCPGLPHEAVLGAWEEAGLAVGFSPATSAEDHVERIGYPTEGFADMVFVPRSYPLASDPEACRKYRNVASVFSVDAAVFIGGGTGTMNEFTIAHDRGVPLGVLADSGGITCGVIQALLGVISGPSPPVIFEEDPEALVAAVVEAAGGPG